MATFEENDDLRSGQAAPLDPLTLAGHITPVAAAGFLVDSDGSSLPELETVEENESDNDATTAFSIDSGTLKEARDSDLASGEGPKSGFVMEREFPSLIESARLRRRKLSSQGAGKAAVVEGARPHKVAGVNEAPNLDKLSDESDQESDITAEKDRPSGSWPSRAYDSDEEEELDEEGRSGTVDYASSLGNTQPANGSIDESNGEAEKKEDEFSLGPLISWPTGWAIQALSFQISLLGQAFLLASWVFHWGYSFLAGRVHKTLEVKNKATEAVSQKLTMISQVPPKVTESGSIVVKRLAWGFMGAAYACLVLSMLVFPAFFFEYMFISKYVEEPVYVKEILQFDYTQPNPSAVIHLHPSKSLRGRLAGQQSKAQYMRPIPISHRIHVTVMLTLPESDYNRQLGMFQLAVELLSVEGEVIGRSGQPCMLRFQSAPIRLAKTFLVGVPVLVGLTGETQTLAIRVMEYQEQFVPTSSVRVLIQPKASSPGGLPEIYFAEMLIKSELPRFKGLVRNWKWTFYVWSGLTLYMLEIMMVICCCRNALVLTTWGSRTEEEVPSGRENKTHGMRQDRTSRRSKRRVHFEVNLPTARVVSVESGTEMSMQAEASRAEHGKGHNGGENL